MSKRQKKLNLSGRKIAVSFENTMVELPLDSIVPTKVITNAVYASSKYKQIVSSIKEIGVIEPLVVTED
ncbi:MAG: ParB/RepB/Spo0J family partition protein, partial [Rickettsiales bacterium]|nr:ParB/RepB/Spo0J family partition protein [Rickettsiales bacterium]